MEVLKRGLLAASASLVPQQGNFYRAELWLKRETEGGTTEHSHWVHPADLTPAEIQTSTSSARYDSAVRSLDELSPNFVFGSGHIILRYGTNGQLSRAVGELLFKLQMQEGELVVNDLENNRDTYGRNHVAHLTAARVFRCLGEKKGITDYITGKHIISLKRAFEGFRESFRPVGYQVTTVQLTSGIRDRREVLMSIERSHSSAPASFCDNCGMAVGNGPSAAGGKEEPVDSMEAEIKLLVEGLRVENDQVKRNLMTDRVLRLLEEVKKGRGTRDDFARS